MRVPEIPGDLLVTSIVSPSNEFVALCLKQVNPVLKE